MKHGGMNFILYHLHVIFISSNLKGIPCLEWNTPHQTKSKTLTKNYNGYLNKLHKEMEFEFLP